MEDGEKEGEYSSRANHPTKGKEGCAEVQQLPHVETNLANAIIFLRNIPPPALASLPGRQQRQGRQSFEGEMKLHLPGGAS